MDPLLRLSATELARRIREREVSASEVLEVHLERIRRFNPRINALVCERFDEARAEARAADELVRTADPATLPPLHGVPCTIKETFSLRGMPNTAGLVSRRGIVGREDATAVERLRAAGAIPVGVTNVPELAMWMECSNRVYGRTNNPYDPARTAGGSSGGEGAIVGAGGSPFGLGSDIGGSIRMPAFFNGVFGHKPTGGLVPATGQYPIAENAALRYLATGPIARRAEDLEPLLRILAGPDGRDPACSACAIGDPAAVDLSTLRVLDVAENGLVGVTPDLRAAQRRCSDWLADQGARVVRTTLGPLRASLRIWSAMMHAAGGSSFRSMLANGAELRPLRELLRWATGRSPHTLPSLVLTLIEDLPRRLPDQTRRYLELGRALREELEERIGPNGVMLYPPYSSPAPRHGLPLLPPIRWAYTAIFNVLEYPVTQVPLGLNGQGLPLGVQVAALPGNDHLTIAVALGLERAFGGWVPPPLPAASAEAGRWARLAQALPRRRAASARLW